MSRKTFLLCTLVAAVSVSLVAVGCMPMPKDPYGLTDPNEPNDSFDEATSVEFTDGSLRISGVLTVADVDVYDLGPMAVGDKITVDIDVPDRIPLDAVVAIFDETGRLFYLDGEYWHINTDTTSDVRMPIFAPHFDFIVRQTTAHLYLAIASLTEPTDTDGDGFLDDYQGFTGGPYVIDVEVVRGGAPPQPAAQVVALWFEEATVDYPPYSEFGEVTDPPPFTVAAFDPQVLDPAYWAQDPYFLALFQLLTGATQLPPGFPTTPDPAFADAGAFKSMIRTALDERYGGRGLDVQFLISGVDPLPPDGSCTVLYITGDLSFIGPGVLGRASELDMLNRNPKDFAVVWAGEIGFQNALSMALDMWLQALAGPSASRAYYVTPEEAAQAVGAVAAHELGHLLGLFHTSDVNDIMEGGGEASIMEMINADWLDVPLHHSIFPIGNQDSYLLLLLTVGLR